MAEGSPGPERPAEAADRKTRVFISYSRKDKGLAEALLAALEARGFEPFLDAKQILPGEAWRERLSDLISKADTVVFLISPDSVLPTSVCDWELNETERLGKRLLPVVARPAPDEAVPSRLRRLNWIFMGAADGFAAGLETLSRALGTDIGWIREHTRLGDLAREWAAKETRGEYALLRGRAIDAAELWISSRPHTKETPDITEEQRSFIQDSRRAEQARAEREREQVARTAWFQRWFGRALAGVGILLVIGVAGTLLQTRATFESAAQVFASLADRALQADEPEKAARYALAGLPPRNSLSLVAPWSASLGAKLASAMQRSKLRGAFRYYDRYPFNGAVLSPDGKYVVTFSEGGAAKVQDVNDGREAASLQHDSAVYRGAFSDDGSKLATASKDGLVYLWDVRSWRKIAKMEGHAASVWSLCFNKSGTRLASGSEGGGVLLWNAADGALVASLEGHAGDVNAIDFNGDGSMIVTASSDHTARLWDGENGSIVAVLMGHELDVNDAAFSPDGQFVMTASSDGAAKVWHASKGLAGGEPFKTLTDHQDGVNHIRFSRDGRKAVTASDDDTAIVWDTLTWVGYPILKGHEGDVQTAEFSPDEKNILTAAWDGTARIWDSESGSAITRLKGHESNLIYDARYSQDGGSLISVSEDVALVWNSGRQEAFFAHDKVVQSVSFSADGRRIITASSDNAAHIFDLVSKKEISVLQGHLDRVDWAVLSPDGNQAATASKDETARIWDVVTGKQLYALEGHGDSLWRIEFSLDGTKVVTAGNDSAARVWDVATGKILSVLKLDDAPVSSAAFSPDGKSVVTASADNKARIWNWFAAKIDLTFDGHGKQVNSAAFSPDGTMLVTASQDATSRVWNARTGKQIAAIKFAFPAHDANFTRDGRRIITVSGESMSYTGASTASIWDVASLLDLSKTRDAALSDAIVHIDQDNGLESARVSPDGTKLAFAGGSTATIQDVTWASGIPDSGLVRDACARLVGGQTFTPVELADPILIGRDDLLNPCLRRGPLHWEYYTQAASRWGRWIGKRWAGWFPAKAEAAAN